MAAAHGCERGGILTLLVLIEEHEPAFAYDWRTRFGLPLQVIEVGDMTWREAWQLTKQLLTDTSSNVFAAIAAWAHPWSREAFVLADLYDLILLAHTDRRHRVRVEPYPRPWATPTGTRLGRATQPQRAVLAALAARGHTFEPAA